MAIRCQNPLTFLTAPNDLGSNVPAFSYSFWIQFNSGVVGATQEQPMTKSISSLGALNVQAYATNNLQFTVQGPPGNVKYATTLQVGQPYCMVATWISGYQFCYLNGVTVATGGIATYTQNSITPLQFGNTATGIANDITISEPGIYYKQLSLQDSINLLLGQSTPASLSGVWYVSFSGIIGTQPASGDAGLTNLGTLGPGLGNKYEPWIFPTNQGSGQYVADLSYSPSTNLNPYVTKNGLVAVVTTNSANQPSAITSIPGSATFYLNGVQQTGVYGPVWFNTTQDTSVAMWRLPTALNASSVVSWTIPFASIISAVGPCGQVLTPQVIPNYFGQLEPVYGGYSPYTPTAASLKMGVNIAHPCMINYYGLNISKNAIYRTGWPTNVTNLDNHQPITIPANTNINLYYYIGNVNGIDSQAVPVPVGVHSCVFNDVNANNSSGLVGFLGSFGEANACIGIDSEYGPAGGGVGVVSLSGTATVSNGSNNVILTTIPRSMQAMTWSFSGDSSHGSYYVTSGSNYNWYINPPFAGTGTLTNSTVTASGSTYLRTVSGTQVTISYIVDYSQFPAYQYGYNLSSSLVF